jgi:hypothetical protein
MTERTAIARPARRTEPQTQRLPGKTADSATARRETPAPAHPEPRRLAQRPKTRRTTAAGQWHNEVSCSDHTNEIALAQGRRPEGGARLRQPPCAVNLPQAAPTAGSSMKDRGEKPSLLKKQPFTASRHLASHAHPVYLLPVGRPAGGAPTAGFERRCNPFIGTRRTIWA